MNFARLNHILIPTTKDKRDELRRGRWWWLVRPASLLHGALSDEGRALSVLVLLVGGAGLDVGTSQVYVLFSALAGMLVASFALRPFFRLPDVGLTVDAPPLVTRGAPCDFEIEIDNRGTNDRLSLRVARPFLPWDGRWEGPPPAVAVLSAAGRARVRARARFVARGHHHIDPFSVAALVPLGFALGPAVRGAGVRFTVVPRIADVRRIDLVADLTRPRGGPDADVHRAEAQELCGVRPYRSGDAVKHLHARTWARLGIPHVREFQEPRLSRVVVALVSVGADVPEEVFEARISLTAGIIACLCRDGVAVDLVVDDGDEVCRVGPGRAPLDAALERLAAVELGRSDGDPSAGSVNAFVDRVTAGDDDLGAAVIVAPLGASGVAVELARDLSRRGVGWRGFSVGDGSPPHPEAPAGFTVVDPARVATTEGLSL